MTDGCVVTQPNGQTLLYNIWGLSKENTTKVKFKTIISWSFWLSKSAFWTLNCGCVSLRCDPQPIGNWHMGSHRGISWGPRGGGGLWLWSWLCRYLVSMLRVMPTQKFRHHSNGALSFIPRMARKFHPQRSDPHDMAWSGYFVGYGFSEVGRLPHQVPVLHRCQGGQGLVQGIVRLFWWKLCGTKTRVCLQNSRTLVFLCRYHFWKHIE